MPNTPSSPTVKQQRDERRAEKVAALKRKNDIAKRNRLIGIWGGSAAGALILGFVVYLIIMSAIPKPEVVIEGLKTWTLEAGNHVDAAAGVDPANPPLVDYEADYGMNPPAGGNHWAGWLNCGIYTEVQQNERAVHALEHGAIWVTYDPEVLTAEEITTLQDSVPSTYMVVSPYPGLPAPVVASAWGYQVQLDGVDDPELGAFIEKYRQSPDGPEYGAACTGAIDGPGKIA